MAVPAAETAEPARTPERLAELLVAFLRAADLVTAQDEEQAVRVLRHALQHVPALRALAGR